MLDVGVVGCGSGGAASAAFLARAGHRVVVWERAPRIAPVGAGLLLQPTGLAVTRELGVSDELEARGQRIERVFGRTERGATIMDLPYAELHPNLHGLGLHRSALLDSLVEAMVSAGAELRLGRAVAACDPVTGVLGFTDGSSSEPFDLVIAADGVNSALLRASGLMRRDREYPWGALWVIAPDPSWPHGDRLQQVFHGTRQLVGALPTGAVGDHRGLVSVFTSVRNDEIERVRAAGVSAWKDEVTRLMPEAAGIVERIADWRDVTHARYRDIVLRRPSVGRLVVIGDAAHAMSPHLGQGANLAMTDAAVLDQCLRGVGAGGVEAALVEFERERRATVRYYQFASRWATFFFQSAVPGLGAVRDLLFSRLGRIRAFRRRQIQTLAGLERGIVRQPFHVGSVVDD